MSAWRYEQEDAWAGVLLKDGRPIVRIVSAGPGHCVDTGNMLALAMMRLERDMETKRPRD